MESSDSIDESWDTTSDLTATTALRSDPLAGEDASASALDGWMVNVAGRDIVEMAQADVIAKWKKRELSPSTLVWREGMDNWAKLESVPTFEIFAKSTEEEDVPGSTEETNLVAVYERPMATLVFDEAVEDEWKAPPKARGPSPGVRGSEPSKRTRSASARPVAPSFPTLAPPKTLSVPADEPPPAPPLPLRRSPAPPQVSRPPMPTIPGGLAPPPPSTPAVQASAPSPSSAPPASALRSSAAPARRFFPSAAPTKSASVLPSAQPKSATPRATTSSAPSPLLAAIAAAASHPGSVVEPTPAPAVASAPESPARASDPASFRLQLQGTKTISLRNAAIACAGSALVASLVTGLVVGSRSPEAVRPAEPTKAVAAATTTPALPVEPTAIPTAAPSPPPTSERTSAAAAALTAEKGALTELAVVEKPKPKSTKPSTWKPPKPIAASPDEPAESERLAPSPERDDPVRAVPDRPVDSTSSSQPAADPGF